MRKILSLFHFIFIANLAICQSVTPDGLYAAADNFISANAQISWTLGDIQTTALRDKGITLIITPGFLQSQFNIVGVEKFSNYNDIEVKVFPNPVQDILNVTYISNQKIELKYELFNIDGKRIYSDKLYNDRNDVMIKFTHLMSGYYILKISSEDKKFYKSFKILYQN